MPLDPWFEGQIRLANKQGILSTMAQSSVQLKAASIMLTLEALDRQRAFTDQFRANALAANPDRWGPVFEEERAQEEAEAYPTFGEITQEDLEEILAQMKEVNGPSE